MMSTFARVLFCIRLRGHDNRHVRSSCGVMMPPQILLQQYTASKYVHSLHFSVGCHDAVVSPVQTDEDPFVTFLPKWSPSLVRSNATKRFQAQDHALTRTNP